MVNARFGLAGVGSGLGEARRGNYIDRFRYKATSATEARASLMLSARRRIVTVAAVGLQRVRISESDS